MYNIYNKSESIFLWDAVKGKEYFIGNEKDLITFIAKAYRRTWVFDTQEANIYLDDFYCNNNEALSVSSFTWGYCNYYSTKRYTFYDGENRTINPKDYEYEAHKLYIEKYKKENKLDRYSYGWWRNNQTIYKGTFRRTPVEGIHNYNKGRHVKPRRIKTLQLMYDNPEFKEFNRGSHKDVPDGWWDDWYRHTERNWKSQRKTQWKER